MLEGSGGARLLAAGALVLVGLSAVFPNDAICKRSVTDDDTMTRAVSFLVPKESIPRWVELTGVMRGSHGACRGAPLPL